MNQLKLFIDESPRKKYIFLFMKPDKQISCFQGYWPTDINCRRWRLRIAPTVAIIPQKNENLFWSPARLHSYLADWNKRIRTFAHWIIQLLSLWAIFHHRNCIKWYVTAPNAPCLVHSAMQCQIIQSQYLSLEVKWKIKENQTVIHQNIKHYFLMSYIFLHQLPL